MVYWGLCAISYQLCKTFDIPSLNWHHFFNNWDMKPFSSLYHLNMVQLIQCFIRIKLMMLLSMILNLCSNCLYFIFRKKCGHVQTRLSVFKLLWTWACTWWQIVRHMNTYNRKNKGPVAICLVIYVCKITLI